MKHGWIKWAKGAMALLLAVTLGLVSFQFSAQAEAAASTSPFTEAIANVKDSVVGVLNYQKAGGRTQYGNFMFPFGYGFPDPDRGTEDSSERLVPYASGSGVVVGEGYVVTNYHVVEGAARLAVTVLKEGEEKPETYQAVLVTADEEHDLAVLKVKDLNLPAVKLGDSDTLKVGDWAICIGNPISEQFTGTVTVGIVSALNRNITSKSTDKYGRSASVTNSMIQTDAAINNGNSGGGMFNTAGELMGIPTQKYSGTTSSGASVDGIGMCIPINSAKKLIEEATSGKIKAPEFTEDDESGVSAGNSLKGKPRMGVTITSATAMQNTLPQGTVPNGVLITEVEKNSPASEGGLMPYDVVVEANGSVISDVEGLRSVISEAKEGDTITLKVFRIPGYADLRRGDEVPEGSYETVEVTLRVVDQVKQ